MLEIYAQKIAKALPPAEKNRIAAVLSREQIAKAEKFKNRADAERSLRGAFLTRCLIGRLVGAAPEKLVFAVDGSGRPGLVFPRLKDFDFNLSHSGDWLALALSDHRVGIDIEKIRPVSALLIGQDFFSSREFDYLKESPRDRRERFFRLWTLKESFVKAVGDGLNYPLKEAQFTIAPDGKIIFRLPAGRRPAGWHFHEYAIDPKCRLAVCSDQAVFPDKVKIIKKL